MNRTEYDQHPEVRAVQEDYRRRAKIWRIDRQIRYGILTFFATLFTVAGCVQYLSLSSAMNEKQRSIWIMDYDPIKPCLPGWGCPRPPD